MVLKGSCERGTNKPPNLLKTQCRVTYDVDDLLQSETEFEHEGLRLVGDGPLQVVVLLHEVVNQSTLVRTAPHACKNEKTIGLSRYAHPLSKELPRARILVRVSPFSQEHPTQFFASLLSP